MSRIIDISVPLSPDFPVWPSDPPLTLEPHSRIANGNGANITIFRASTHCGTHVDAPWHFIDDGNRLDDVSLDDLNGPCHVCDLRHLEHNVTAEDLDAAIIPDDTRRLLIRTRNSELWESPTHAFNREFIGVADSGAQWIVERGIRLIGIDYHSIEPMGNGGSVHRTLLSDRVVILETLDLRNVEAGGYDLSCLPLRIAESDGAPCRAVLIARRRGQ